MNLDFSWNTKIKSMQAICYIGSIYGLLNWYNTSWFIISLIFGYIVAHGGISIYYHRCVSHKSFKFKNSFIENIFYFLGILATMGPAINWSGTHRLHHATSDSDKDPHSPVNKDRFTIIKYWFNYWEHHNVAPKYVKDLIKNSKHKFVYKNYWIILISYIVLISLIFEIHGLIYLYLIPAAFALHITSWITVGAHIWGTKKHDTSDESLNTDLMGYFMAGEGWHNSHHHNPSKYDFGEGKFDLCGWIIKKYLISR